MIRDWIRRYGAVRITLAVSLLSMAGSVALAALLDLTLKGRIAEFDLPIAAVIPGILAPLISYQFIRLSHQLDRAEDELRHVASIDSLTQVYNRGHILLLAEKEILRARRYVHPLSLLLLDLDLFKLVNDRYGHSVGDRLLRSAADLFSEQLRRSDWLGRYGGEEFMVILPETDEKGARLVAERMRSAVKASPLKAGNTMVTVTVSVGGTDLRPEMQDIDAFLAHADAALYRAKERGRDRVEFA
ncbi:MAG: GGDEF domain-containing protein [Anaerolineales bacterium]